jgi:UDP-N-acetylglucosamine acyltransferase
MLKKTYRLVFRIGLTQAEAVARVRAEIDQIPEVIKFIDFITSSQRGVTR